jgi:DNA-binding transcriptional regulator YiaG
VKRGPRIIVHTLESLKARCMVCGDCWTWQGSVSVQNQPKTRHDGKVWNVRNLAYKLQRGIAVRTGYTAVATCKNPMCVNPEHLTQREISGLISELNRTKPQSLVKKAKISAYRRTQSALSPEIVAAIRNREKPRSQFAKELGVSYTTIKRAEIGVTWQEYRNPWAGLMA